MDATGFLLTSDFESEFPPGSAVEADPALEPGQAELEAAFEDWLSENYDLLVERLPVDVLDLRLRLNAAFANSCNSSRSTPSAL